MDEDDPQVPDVVNFFGTPGQGVFRLNSYYPQDGFWWDSQLRISPGFPTNLHYLEHAAFALAEYDALRITRGGLFLDTGHAEQVRDFALAFRTLPDRKFETVGSLTDPVTMRTSVADGARYLYLVNRDYYPVTVRLRTAEGNNAVLTDTVSGAQMSVEAEAALKLGPYQLRTFTMSVDQRLELADVAIPAEIERQLISQASEFFSQFEQLQKRQTAPLGADNMAARMRESVDQKSYARLRRQLTSYVVRKTGELAAGTQP